METNFTVGLYVVYLVVSILLTVWVARTLSKNGITFLIDAFHGNERLANSVNHLLVVGFYLINCGFVARFLRAEHRPGDLQQTIEVLADKEGVVLLVLGVMHFFNLVVFTKLRNRGRLPEAPPPVQPRQYVPPPPRPQTPPPPPFAMPDPAKG